MSTITATRTPETHATTAPAPDAKLTSLDRCDQCGAKAWVRATLASTGHDLLYCAHHANAHEAKLRPMCSAWHDETGTLRAEASKRPGA